MSQLLPFRALRPAPAVAFRVASVPYDVVNTSEARALATAIPLSFLRVTRSEVDFPPDTPPYDDRVYARAAHNLAELRRTAPLVQDEQPALYLYRLRMGSHQQVGVAGLFSVDEYNRGLIKKHEKTRKDKEDDRTRHIVETGAQTGVVFLTYRASRDIDAAVARALSGAPLYAFTATDGVTHELWRVMGPDADELVRGFAALPALYIADGHHRAASAARSGADHFIAVAFPDNQVQILAYNRTVKDLGEHSSASFFEALSDAGMRPTAGPPVPERAGHVSMYIDRRWYTLELPAPGASVPQSDTLDVEVLQQRVLQPILGVGDPRTDKRIDFVGGIRGAAELERLVNAGKAAVAFSLYPVSVADLLAIADAGGIMPPKSTWFEPKLRDGLLVYLKGT
jgi:uncharacterized protein (DUF1015 family)